MVGSLSATVRKDHPTTIARIAPNASSSAAGSSSAATKKEWITGITLHNREKWGWLLLRIKATGVTFMQVRSPLDGVCSSPIYDGRSLSITTSGGRQAPGNGHLEMAPGNLMPEPFQLMKLRWNSSLVASRLPRLNDCTRVLKKSLV